MWAAPVRPGLPRSASAKRTIASDAEMNDPSSEKETVGSQMICHRLRRPVSVPPVMGHLISIMLDGEKTIQRKEATVDT